MAKVSITISDQLLDQAQRADLDISAVAARALLEEVDRQARLAQFDAYLTHLDAVHGPAQESQVLAAEAWADQAIGPRPLRTGW